MTLPKIVERERCKVGGMDGNLFQNIFFKVFCSIFRLQGAFLNEKGKMVSACTFQGQIGKLSLKTPGNWAFSSFNPIFLLVPP